MLQYFQIFFVDIDLLYLLCITVNVKIFQSSFFPRKTKISLNKCPISDHKYLQRFSKKQKQKKNQNHKQVNYTRALALVCNSAYQQSAVQRLLELETASEQACITVSRRHFSWICFKIYSQSTLILWPLQHSVPINYLISSHSAW